MKDTAIGRLQRAIGMVIAVGIVGTIGYWLFGMSVTDATYQTVTTVTDDLAGADRVVNPQELGAARMASFVARPHVAEFVDVVMHERSLEFRMQEFDVPDGSALAGQTLREADLRKRAGVLILALRRVDRSFSTNPDPDILIEPHQVLIAVGTGTDFDRLDKIAR